jgi:hypothetical protein
VTQWVPQPSFGKGEIAPALYGRFDLALYGIGAKQIENFIVARGGGLVNTPGTRFIGEIKDSAKKARLRKFSFNTQQTYTLEFGDLYMRVIKDGGYVVYDSGPDVGDIFELLTPYKEEDLPLMKFVQSADVLTINHPAHPTYDLTRLDHDNWTLTAATFGVQMVAPVGLTATAVGGSGSETYRYVVTAVNSETGEESLPSSIVTVNNNANLSQTVYNRIEWTPVTAIGASRGSFVVKSSGNEGTAASITAALTFSLQPGITIDGIQITTGSSGGASFPQSVVNSINNGNSGYTASVISGFTVKITAPLGVQYNSRRVVQIITNMTGGTTQSDVGFLSGGSAATHGGAFSDVKVNGVSVMSSSVAWAGSTVQTAFDIASRITASNLGYTASSVGSTVLIDAPASAGSTPNGYVITTTSTGTVFGDDYAAFAGGGGTAIGGAGSYNIYKERNGVYGFIGKSMSDQFEDRNILADVSDTPQQARNPFANNNNPYCATYYDQRKVYAEAGQVLDFSQSGGYRNFNVSEPRRDDDAMTRRIAARQVNEIRHLIPIRELLVLTSGGIWKIAAGSQGDAITPTNMTVRLQSEIGVSHVEPIVVGDIVLYVQDKGSIIRDLGYSFQADNYVGADLTIVSSHLFDGREVVQWDYAAVPNSVVWCVLDNGRLATMTYIKDQELIAWTQQVTDGFYESVSVVSEGNEDAVYVIVRREIDGETKRYVERFESRNIVDPADSFFVHSGLSYRGDPVDEISGLDHLEGREVAILCDGSVLPRQTVEDGSVTLPVEGSVIHVGLPYFSTLETLPVGDTQGGIGRRKKIVKLRARVERSRGMWVGPSLDEMTEMKRDPLWTNNLPTDEVEILTVPETNEQVTAFIQQRDPLPLSIQAVIPEVDS